MHRFLLLALVAFSSQGIASDKKTEYPPLPTEEQAPYANSWPPAPIDARLAEVNDTGELLRLAAALDARDEHDDAARVWKRLAELRPHMGGYRYEMAAQLAQRNYKALVYNTLIELQGQGYAFDLAKDDRFAKARGTEVWQYVVEAFDVNRQPFGEGRVRSTLPAEDLLLESLAWDPSRDSLLVGSARTGTVYRVDGGGKLAPIVKADESNGMWGVFDLVVDAERGFLWVASTAVPHFKGYDAEQDLGGAGIFKFDLKTGKFIKRFLSPQIAGQQFFMSSLALAPDGTVFAADGVNNAIYSIREDSLRRLLHAPVLTSIRGMAVSDDGKRLYFADYERGVFGFDLEAEKPFEVGLPPKLMLSGIDGLVYWKGHLVAVQNGMIPKRIMKLKLSSDGRSFASFQPLDANKPALTLPTFATVHGDQLLLIANSQKGNYDRFGLVRDKSKIVGTQIYQTDLNFGSSDAPAPTGPLRQQP